jgi:hypothetical protein
MRRSGPTPLLEPVRQSWATGNESLVWTKVHDLPDYVYFNHSIHVNKGLGCASCHGRVDLMPLMYQQNTLQMEWCLNCHRDPAKNLRPGEPDLQHGVGRSDEEKPVWCSVSDEKTGSRRRRAWIARRGAGQDGSGFARLNAG